MFLKQMVHTLASYYGGKYSTRMHQDLKIKLVQIQIGLVVYTLGVMVVIVWLDATPSKSQISGWKLVHELWLVDVLLQLHWEAWVRFIVLNIIAILVYAFYGQHHAGANTALNQHSPLYQRAPVLDSDITPDNLTIWQRAGIANKIDLEWHFCVTQKNRTHPNLVLVFFSHLLKCHSIHWITVHTYG